MTKPKGIDPVEWAYYNYWAAITPLETRKGK
jgi:hypothetical protein